MLSLFQQSQSVKDVLAHVYSPKSLNTSISNFPYTNNLVDSEVWLDGQALLIPLNKLPELISEIS